jgi:hypothetical protein
MMHRVRLAVFSALCAVFVVALLPAAQRFAASEAVADPASDSAVPLPAKAPPATPESGTVKSGDAAAVKNAPAKGAAVEAAPLKSDAGNAPLAKGAREARTPGEARDEPKDHVAPSNGAAGKAALADPAKPAPDEGRPGGTLKERKRAEQVLPANVSAVYRISFGVLGDIGHFRFKSEIAGESYVLTADAKIDTSIFDYAGSMRSNGAVLRATVTKPAGYKFKYRQKAIFGKKKVRALSMDFNDTGVKDVSFVPPDPPSPKAIPVTSEQLKSALDPLTGVMALSLGDIDHPCDRRLPIFDGKQRFDLVFRPTGRRDGPAGAQVCHVKLVPISGHKPGEGAGSVITGNIEVVLRPVPKANILIPYRVTVPTIIGAATLMSEKIDITMPDRQRIALRR